MARNRILGVVGLAAVALATGFLLAGQVKAQLLTPSNEVGRYQALVRSVQDLEKTNEASRAKIAALRAEIDALEGPAPLLDLRTRQVRFQIALTVAGIPDLKLPAYDSSLQIPHVSTS